MLGSLFCSGLHKLEGSYLSPPVGFRCVYGFKKRARKKQCANPDPVVLSGLLSVSLMTEDLEDRAGS